MKAITGGILKQCGIRSNSTIYNELLSFNETGVIYRFRVIGSGKWRRLQDRWLQIEKAFLLSDIDCRIENDAPGGGRMGVKYVRK